MILLDSHCDTPSQILRLRDIGIDNRWGHVDFPKLRQGGVDASFFALFTPASMQGDQATGYAMRMLAATLGAVRENPDMASMAYCVDDIIANKAGGKTSILLGMENGSPVQESLDLLRCFQQLGVRYVTLTHNGDNAIADCAAEAKTWGGLSPFGKEVVAEMNRLGMIVDVAHASDATFYDCLKYSKVPIVSTHSCCRALCSHRRNMSDDMLRALAEAGGVIQINFYPTFLSDDFARDFAESGMEAKADEVEARFRADPVDPDRRAAWNAMRDELETIARPSYKDVVNHIDHAVEVMGIDHVGIGSDFDGIEVSPAGLENVSKMGIVIDELRLRGYSDEAVEKIAGGNFLRIMRIAEDFASKA